MNVQRWIALGVVGVIATLILTSNVWLTPILERGNDEETPTPDMSATAAIQVDSAESDATEAGTVTPTLNPVIQEMMDQLGETMGAGNQPFVILTGDFSSIDNLHQAAGTVSIYQVGDKRYILRVDPLNVTNGPDLHILLCKRETPRTATEAIMGSLDLGALASPTVPQNFQIPADTVLDPYKGVVIYSRSLNIIYTSAKLSAVRGTQNR